MFKEALIPRIGAGEMRVELDKKSLFALASDTRLDILRSLQPMRRTVTQLAETLGIDKAAVHRHLKKLEEGGLVKRYEDHGFVYYGLSWKARDLMSPSENTRVIVLLSSSWIMILIAAFLVIATISIAVGGIPGSGPTPGGNQMSSGNTTGNQGAFHDIFAPATNGGLPLIAFIVPAVALAVAGVALVLVASKTLIRPKQTGARPEGSIPDAPDDRGIDD